MKQPSHLLARVFPANNPNSTLSDVQIWRKTCYVLISTESAFDQLKQFFEYICYTFDQVGLSDHELPPLQHVSW